MIHKIVRLLILTVAAVTVTSAKKVIRSVLSFCHSVCVQHYCNSDEPISLKLDVMIEPTSRKNWLTFDGNLLPDTDSGSLSTSRTIAE